jgi:hypothetical protein
MDERERKAYYEAPPPTYQPSGSDGGDGCAVILLSAWLWLPILALVVWGLVVLGRIVVRRVSHFVITAIFPHWLAIVVWIAIAAVSVCLVLILVRLLTPPIRRMRIRLYYRRQSAALQWRSKQSERQLTQIFEEAHKRANDIVARHTEPVPGRNKGSNYSGASGSRTSAGQRSSPVVKRPTGRSSWTTTFCPAHPLTVPARPCR